MNDRRQGNPGSTPRRSWLYASPPAVGGLRQFSMASRRSAKESRAADDRFHKNPPYRNQPVPRLDDTPMEGNQPGKSWSVNRGQPLINDLISAAPHCRSAGFAPRHFQLMPLFKTIHKRRIAQRPVHRRVAMHRFQKVFLIRALQISFPVADQLGKDGIGTDNPGIVCFSYNRAGYFWPEGRFPSRTVRGRYDGCLPRAEACLLRQHKGPA
jgi:hypothetical protein